MNSALKNLKDTKPQLFELLLNALGEDLGLATGEPLTRFLCPNCNARFDVVLSNASRTFRRKPGRPANLSPSAKVSTKGLLGGSRLNDLLIALARLRRTTTGTINLQFKKSQGSKLKGLTKNEVRALKIDWLKSELIGQKQAKKTA